MHAGTIPQRFGLSVKDMSYVASAPCTEGLQADVKMSGRVTVGYHEKLRQGSE